MPKVAVSTQPSIPIQTDRSPAAVEPRVGYGGNTISHLTAAITDLGSWTAKVADLNVRMSRHLQSFPEVVPGDRNTGQSLSATGEECAAFGIDKTLHLSQDFIDTLSQTLDMIPPALGPWRRLATEASEASPNAVSLNAASELLMISTYLHHLEIYDRVFRHIQASLSRARKGSNASLPFAVPRLTIGSFSLSSRPETQLHFTLGLMESMLVRCRDLMGQITAPRDTRGHRGGFECFGGVTMVIVPDLALQAMRTRETMILGLADEVKKNLKL
ncbi:hypothetical protein VMCG_04705 [Cytospora schulzeri]|uniref:Uncharacterized protein n=1 Tax=Cytospora schulzeri TaxID=448051 RepID=A0A423WRN4_9PEZI|nr:hypothetical protein VMCG_04705 [Valsa malicola]